MEKQGTYICLLLWFLVVFQGCGETECLEGQTWKDGVCRSKEATPLQEKDTKDASGGKTSRSFF